MMKDIRQIVCLACLALVCGCSTFNEDYQKTAAQNAQDARETILGAWEGTWQSNAGHGSGKLYAIVNQESSSAQYPVFAVRFRAHYWGLFKAEYDIVLRQVSSEPLRFKGEHDLGFLAGGLYEYEATVTREHFDATYKSGADHGVFKMARP